MAGGFLCSNPQTSSCVLVLKAVVYSSGFALTHNQPTEPNRPQPNPTASFSTASYVKSQLASADYDGVVQLWDVNTGTDIMQVGGSGLLSDCAPRGCLGCLLNQS